MIRRSTLTFSQIFNTKHTRDARKRIQLPYALQSGLARDVATLLKKTEGLHGDRFGRHHSLWHGINRAIQAANAHAFVGDILVQSQGQAAAFAWSSIRLLLRVSGSFAGACGCGG